MEDPRNVKNGNTDSYSQSDKITCTRVLDTTIFVYQIRIKTIKYH